MQKVKLSEPIHVDGKEIKEINLNLSSLKGRDIIAADREARMHGVTGLNPLFTQEGLLIVASKACGIKYDDLLQLSAPDFMDLTMRVQNFLMGLDLAVLETMETLETLSSPSEN